VTGRWSQPGIVGTPILPTTVTFEQWQLTVPASLTRDPIWKRADYRLATFVADAAWPDAERLATHPATRKLADQLYSAVGSIGAHIAEGYSRGTGADRIRYYEYALGSARETREWYWKARHVIGEAAMTPIFNVLEQIVRLLLTAIKGERQDPRRRPRST
jgi:four helix bundle protein